jgi:hypothetical protein
MDEQAAFFVATRVSRDFLALIDNPHLAGVGP